VLVVEDHAQFRKIICAKLREKWPPVQIIEATDGLEAVQRAQELQPDLILIDVGLPTLNGIQAARQIRHLSPKSTLLFVSLASSGDVVQQAFRSGASGYVNKSNVARELLVAVEAVLRGEQFLGDGLTKANCLRTSASSRDKNTSAAEA
jgi:DNA-binding NarL/FixJ family response regulator